MEWNPAKSGAKAPKAVGIAETGGSDGLHGRAGEESANPVSIESGNGKGDAGDSKTQPQTGNLQSTGGYCASSCGSLDRSFGTELFRSPKQVR